MPSSTISLDPLLDRKIQDTLAELPNYCSNVFHSLLKQNESNAMVVINYIATMKREVNLSTNYRQSLIKLFSGFSNYCNHKDFKDIGKQDVISFLDSLRKTDIADPLHKWIGTYNVYRVHLVRFFKWLYFPDLDPSKRPKPAIIENIPMLKRKEKSIYKPSDLWTPDDDLLFLKFCPSRRDKCYHAISRDLSGRPHEILKLKIKDIAFKTIGTSQYVEVVVNGKTGTRPIPLINSVPYLKDYLEHEHPQPRNPNAPLICGVGRGLARHIGTLRINGIYKEYKEKVFPKLLESPNVLPEDKQKIRELLKKPWNPYIRRHSALTEKSMLLKEHILRQHAGWTPGSQMHLKYLHYFGNESSESLLEAYGLVDHGIQINQLRSKQCPQCSEPNKPDSKFCSKCKMVLSYDAYEESLKEQEKKGDRLTTIENQFNTLKSQIQSLLSSLGTIKDQNQVNQMAKTLYNSNILKKEKCD